MRTFSAIALLVFAVAASACEPEKPAMPSFAKDVAPIFKAHCVRCHGAGGTLNIEPRNPLLGPPGTCHLDIYNNEGDCTSTPPVNCRIGALTCAPLIPTYVVALKTMPPPPAELNDWEKDVINSWAATMTPLP